VNQAGIVVWVQAPEALSRSGSWCGRGVARSRCGGITPRKKFEIVYAQRVPLKMTVAGDCLEEEEKIYAYTIRSVVRELIPIDL